MAQAIAQRAILHVDMDAFYASIEVLDHPHLAGLPILVGSDRPRGVVSTASYEARKFGCHSAQPTATARRLCPQAVVMPVRMGRYREVSRQLMSIFESFTPVVEPLSLDEAFLDVTGSQRLLGDAVGMARQIKQKIREELCLSASVGVASNKFLAKLGSDFQKPDGLTIIDDDNVLPWLAKLPVGKIWGVGPRTAQSLADVGIRTIGDLRAKDEQWLIRRLGKEGARYAALSRGQDDRPVTPDAQAKSIGQEQTFETDVPDADQVRSFLLGQVEEVAWRMRRHGLRARGVGLKLRFGDFRTITRQATLPQPTDHTDDLWASARALFDAWAKDAFEPIRLVGMSASRFERADEAQLSLFPDARDEKLGRLDKALDTINSRFGKLAIRRGGPEQ